MKEFRILKGHKKEVCCTPSLHSTLSSHSLAPPPPAVAWHPVHPILVSGGSEGSILHWDLSTPTPPASLSTTPSSLPASSLSSLTAAASSPRATLSQAHDSNVWSLAYHPLGHLLVTASNDQTTRFWSRERPGESTSVEKPSDVVDMSGQDDDDDIFVPGFGAAAIASTGRSGYAGSTVIGLGTPYGRSWGGKEEEDQRQPSSMGMTSGTENGYGGQSGGQYDLTGDDFIPGFGASAEPARPPQQDISGGPPLQDEFGRDLPSGGPNGRDRDSRDNRDKDGDWGRGGGGNRSGRWGPRRGRY